MDDEDGVVLVTVSTSAAHSSLFVICFNSSPDQCRTGLGANMSVSASEAHIPLFSLFRSFSVSFIHRTRHHWSCFPSRPVNVNRNTE